MMPASRLEVPPALAVAGPEARVRAEAAARATRFDLVVIGGGISGVSVARDAALRGLRVLVLEQDDIASGTSSGSTKLAHGGFRYLQQGHLRLVRTACQEREILRRTAPHIVEPLRFLFPSWSRGDFPSRPISPLLLHAGLTAYDLFAGSRGRRHRMLSASAAVSHEPRLRRAGLRAAALYDDATLDDARLTVAVACSAARAGATVLTRTRLESLARDRRGHVRAVHARDVETGVAYEIATRAVVLACGPWGDEVRRTCEVPPEPPLRLTQGVHAIVPHAACPIEEAVVLTSPADGRLAFAVPWAGVTLLGTTDTDIERTTDARVRAADVEYVLEAARATLPGAALESTTVVQATTVAVRPLVVRSGGRSAVPSAVPREHALLHDDDGVFTLAGGKLTTARAVAQETTDAVTHWLMSEHGMGASHCTTRTTPLEGGTLGPPAAAWQTIEPWLDELHAAASLDPATKRRIAGTYGDQAPHVFALLAMRPALSSRVCETGTTLLEAEVAYMAQHEFARSVEDVLARRARLLLTDPDNGLAHAPGVARVLADEFGWDAARRQRDVDAYGARVASMHAWRHPAGDA